ncbi:MAG: DUF2158 domain-containing protein [Hyphomonadaceae bacterium]
METLFKCGDRVRLKSGGALMAVTGVSPDSQGRLQVWCAWFDPDHAHRTAGYDADALEMIERADLGPPP